MRAKIGQYAATTTTAATVKRWVHKFKKAYLKEKGATNKEVIVLKSRKLGRPKLLPKDIMAKTIQTVKALH